MILLLLLGAFSACVPNVSTNVPPSKIETTLAALLDEAVADAHGRVPGVSMTVVAPDLKLHWSGAAGYDSHERDQALSEIQAFRVASVTKTYVAAALLRLVEMGKVQLDDALDQHLPETFLQLLQTGGYSPNKITIRQCLHHTSGLFDYALGSRNFIERILKDPQHRWTRQEQLELAMNLGKATGAPGERYAYGDTGYILVGAIIEKYTEQNLALALRQTLGFDRLGLQDTWLESLEPAPEGMGDPVHRYLGRNDATEWDASIDLYGGGGLQATTDDLARFIQALFNEEVFQKPSTLSEMLRPATYAPDYDWQADENYEDYRLGFWVEELYGSPVYLHNGFWGSCWMYLPELNATIALNYVDGYADRLLKKTALLLKNNSSPN